MIIVTTDLSEAGMAMSGSDAKSVARLEELLSRYGVLLRSVIARHCPTNLGIHTSDIEQEARMRLWRALEREKELGGPCVLHLQDRRDHDHRRSPPRPGAP